MNLLSLGVMAIIGWLALAVGAWRELWLVFLAGGLLLTFVYVVLL